MSGSILLSEQFLTPRGTLAWHLLATCRMSSSRQTYIFLDWLGLNQTAEFCGTGIDGLQFLRLNSVCCAMITIRIDITEMAGATSAKCIATDVDATDMEKKLLESIVDSLGLPKNIVHHCAKDLADKYRISANKPPL